MRKTFWLSLLLVLFLAGCTPIALPGSAPQTAPGSAAEPARRVSFATDWTWQGVYAAYPVAQAAGYYADEGIDITIDRGFGSGDTIAKVAAGTYDFGIADLGVLIRFNAQNPDEALTAVAIMWDYSPLSILTLRGHDIETPLDLAGKTLAAPEGSASRVMFPAFARAVGLDPESVTWTTVAPELREPLLIERQVDATAPFLDAMITLQGLGVDPADIIAFHYPEYGLEIYGLSLITRPGLVEEEPELVRGMVAATIKGWQDTIADPDNAIAVLRQKDELVDVEVERARLDLAIERLIYTPWIAEYGFGNASPERLQAHIDATVDAMGLEISPDASTLFTDKFLPPLEERQLPEQER
jgi:NitT/TauT family transport system substrate-binding protein